MRPKKITKTAYIPAKLRKRNIGYESFLKHDHTAETIRRIESVIEQEAPISERLLRKRVLNSMGIFRSGATVSLAMDGVLETMDLCWEEEEGERFFWQDERQKKTYAKVRISPPDDADKRDILDISVREAACALVLTLRDGCGDTEEELIRAAANLMGYTRIGTNVRRKMAQALAWGTGSGYFRKTKDRYLL